MLQRICVPLDGSLVAETAVSLAVRLARATQATIDLVRVLPPTPFDLLPETEATMTQAQEAAEGEARTYLHEVTQRQAWQGVDWHTHVKRGPIASTILKTIATTGADLTILCRHGHAGPVRWPLGRVAEKIARHAPSAVLLLDQAGSSLPEQDLRVLVPLDTSPFAEKALQPAVQLLTALTAPDQATIHLLHAYEAWVHADLLEHLLKNEVPQGDETQLAAIQHLHQYLRQQAASLQQGASSELHASWSMSYDADAAQTILAVAETGRDTHGIVVGQPFDLIVLADHGRGGWERWALGSITERVLHATTLPLLIVHPSSAPQ